MSNNRPTPGAGDVEITLDGEKRVLRPTLNAIRKVSRLADGVGGAVAKVQKVDFDAIVMIVAVGLDLTEEGAKGLEEKVFATGAMNLSAPCVKYLTILANGGRPITTEDGSSKENPPASD